MLIKGGIKKMNDENTILIRIPTEVKKQLQIIAIQNDTNMSDIIRDLIQNYIKNYEKSKNI